MTDQTPKERKAKAREKIASLIDEGADLLEQSVKELQEDVATSKRKLDLIKLRKEAGLES